MKRVSTNRPKVPEEGDIILSKSLRDFLLDLPDASDVLGLYLFYQHTADWQNTNQPRATDKYCMEALGMGGDRFDRAKKILTKVGLIKQLRIRNDRGTFEFYVRVYYYLNSHYAEISRMDKNNEGEDDEKSQVADTHHSSVFHSSEIRSQMLGSKKLNASAEESKSPLHGKKRMGKPTVTKVPWNPPPQSIFWSDWTYIRQEDGRYMFYYEKVDKKYYLSEDQLKYYRKKDHWKEPDE